jgi:ABC-type phosphate/phosphonate transport system substrate-binding protein
MRFLNVLALLLSTTPAVVGKEDTIDSSLTKVPEAEIEQVDATVQQEEVISDPLDCSADKVEFNPLVHKQKYRVGVYANNGAEAVFQQYNLTFAEYLTATAGQRFDPPIEFELSSENLFSLFNAAETEDVDFFFANAAAYSCMGLEHGAQPLATAVSRLTVRGHTFDLDVYGGVMFTLADNDEINDVSDFKEKVIGAGGITMMMGGQAQFYEMIRNGVSYINDPKQVVFTGNEADTVQGVLDGDFDVGFARTDQIERHLDANGDRINPGTCCACNPSTQAETTQLLFRIRVSPNSCFTLLQTSSRLFLPRSMCWMTETFFLSSIQLISTRSGPLVPWTTSIRT